MGIRIIHQLVPDFLFSSQAEMHIHLRETENYLNDLAKILGTGSLRLLYDKSLNYNQMHLKEYENGKNIN